ncbi:MAG: hypothetical protein ABIY55_25680 [Kofleriaceae bacterium]
MYRPIKHTAAIGRTKLSLRRETIAHLATVQLRTVAGGFVETLSCESCGVSCASCEIGCGVSQLGRCDPNSGPCTGL